MPAEIIPEIVKVTTTMIPALRTIPILRGLLIPLSATGEMNQAKALEEYQAEADKKKKQREKVQNQNNKHVIKIKDALKCVENTLANGKIGIAFAKALLNVLTKGTGAKDMVDLIYGPIQDCMLKKMLQQKNKTSRGKYVKTKGPGTTKTQEFSELVRLRRGKLHPFLK